MFSKVIPEDTDVGDSKEVKKLQKCKWGSSGMFSNGMKIGRLRSYKLSEQKGSDG